MNKGNLNKLVTNYPVQLTNEEVENLSLTLSAVRTAGGGGGEGKTYHGEGFVSVNNTNNSISLTTEANEKLNQDIPTKVSDLSDSANYQTVAGMDEYLTTANAQTLYQTKEAMSDYAQKTEIPDSITDFADTSSVIYSYINPLTGDIQQQLNGKQNKLQFDLNAKGEISAIGTLNGTTTALAGANGITGDYYSASNPSGFITSSVGALDNFYSKTDTSSKTEISNAFDNIPKYILNGDSNITATSAQEGNNVRWDLAVNATPVVTDTTLTGDKGIYTHTTTKSGEWCVELVQSAYAAINDVQNKLDTTVAAQTYQPKGNYAPESITADVNTLTAASAGWNNKVDKPTSLVNQYLVLRTDGAGNVSGWCDFQDQSYSKSEAQRTFVATANIDTTTLSGDGKSVSTKLGVKTDVIATRDYVSGNYLPTSGGTVSGQLEVHGGSNFDSQFIKLTREGNSCGARIGLGSDTTNGTLALKTFNGQGQNTVQVNIKHNTNNNELIQVQKGGSDVGFLIPAVTATTTAGLTNDGILHIILES